MNKPKLIILYGFAASGKTTLAKKYISQNPMSFCLESDVLISHIGDWRKNEVEARNLIHSYIKILAKAHLQKGFSVAVPCLLNDVTYPQELQRVAEESGADFREVYIDIEKEDAVNRLLGRGCWGEEGSRQLTEDDRVMLEGRFDYMKDLMQSRPEARKITSKLSDIENTYEQMLLAV